MKVEWNKCTALLPKKDGEYLVVKSIFGMFSIIDVCKFTHSLHKVDKFNFPNEDRPGWYAYDDEYGYVEWSGITHWVELPELPSDLALCGGE